MWPWPGGTLSVKCHHCQARHSLHSEGPQTVSGISLNSPYVFLLNVCKWQASPWCIEWLSMWHEHVWMDQLPSWLAPVWPWISSEMWVLWATKKWQFPSELTLYPTGKSWQSWVHPLTLRFKHSFTLQFLSSELSPQSSLPSQRLLSEIQRPLEHMKKEPLHKLPKKRKTWPITAKTARASPAKLGSTFVTWQWNLTD